MRRAERSAYRMRVISIIESSLNSINAADYVRRECWQRSAINTIPRDNQYSAPHFEILTTFCFQMEGLCGSSESRYVSVEATKYLISPKLKKAENKLKLQWCPK